MAGKYLLTTLGCKVNQYESQQLRDILESHGLSQAQGKEPADVAIVNTCAVTAEATRKSRQAIRKLGRNGRTSVIVVGCAASAEGQQLRNLPGVAAVVGHDADIEACVQQTLVDLGSPITTKQIDQNLPGKQATTQADNGCRDADRYDVSMNPGSMPGHDASASQTIRLPEFIIGRPLPIVNSPTTLTSSIRSFSGQQRAYLKIQDGCDAYCSYCIIPRLRPTLKSKPLKLVISEARGLISAGHREIILTGLFLGAYGRETAIRKRWRLQPSPLAELVDALAQIDGLVRLRLSSLEPGDVTSDLLEVLAKHQCCVPHLHLPLQSGSSEILRKMNRQYTIDGYYEMIEQVRQAFDRPAITTDIIVGFPGESDQDFIQTLETAQCVGFSKIHAFPYSPRERTAAARWSKSMVPSTVVRKRMSLLAELERDLSFAYRRDFAGDWERVVVEASKAQEPKNLKRTTFSGRADRYFRIHFQGDQIAAGEIVRVRIDHVTPTRTHGTLSTDTLQLRSLPVLSDVFSK